MWATGTKLKIKLIGVRVANNRKAEKSGVRFSIQYGGY